MAIAVIPFDDSFFSFTLCAETLSPPYILSPSLISRPKTLESLLMPLHSVIFVNTILQLNSLDITVFVVTCPRQSYIERTGTVRFCFFVIISALPCKINHSRRIWFSLVSVMSEVCNRTRKSVWISITGIATAPPIKVIVQLLGQFHSEELELFFFSFVIMWDE